MKRNRVVDGFIGSLMIGLFGFLGSGPAWSSDAGDMGPAVQQENVISLPKDNLEHLEQLANYGKLLKDQFGEKTRLFSNGAQRLINLGERWDAIKPGIQKALETGAKGKGPIGTQNKLLLPGSNVNSSDDFLSRFSGMTQSETSSAWWGANGIICFNDSGSFNRTLLGPNPSPSGSFSFNGWSQSTNANAAAPTFTDKGVMIPDPNPAGVLLQDLFGDPVAGTTNLQRFYCCSLSTIYRRSYTSIITNSAISVVRSTNGGATFGSAVPAVERSTYYYFLDKPWMAVKSGASATTDSIYLTYTNFYAYGADTIEFVKSTNGGTTWSSPVVIASSYGTLQGSQVAVAPNGTIYVTWEEYDYFPCGNRHIKIRKSTDNGVTFSAAVNVTDLVPCGDGYRMQGNFRNFVDCQGLAVNPFNSNEVYVVYQDGKDKSIFEPNGLYCSMYNFANIYFRRSTDGGATWSSPIKVNSDLAGANIDQFQAGIAVENKKVGTSNFGRIFVTFYDRRIDTRNFNMQCWRAISSDNGATWPQATLSGTFSPITGWEDVLVNDYYMGDYNDPASDSNTAAPAAGFIANWGDNSRGDANVEFSKIP